MKQVIPAQEAQTIYACDRCGATDIHPHFRGTLGNPAAGREIHLCPRCTKKFHQFLCDSS